VVPEKARKRRDSGFEAGDNIRSEMQEVTLPAHSVAVGKRIVELNIPPSIAILAVKRDDVFIAPNGSTRLMAGDVLHLLAEEKETLEQLFDLLHNDPG
jgi:cell volume regulation protein A